MHRECRSRSGSDPQDANEQEESGKAAFSQLRLVFRWGKMWHLVSNCDLSVVGILDKTFFLVKYTYLCF